jgi:hypothetical protein
MKQVTIYCNFKGREIEVDVYEASGFQPGDKVVHANEGLSAGSAGIIQLGEGVVVDVEYCGPTIIGGHAWVATVKFENEEWHGRTTCLKRGA